MPSPLDDKELTAVLAHRWAIDCLRMTLRPQGTNTAKYSGPGSVRCGAEGQLEYVLYDTTADCPDFKSFGGAPGEWLKAEDFYVLSAIDQSGREWTAEWVAADTSTTNGETGAVVYGSLRELTCQFSLGSDRSGAFATCAGFGQCPSERSN